MESTSDFLLVHRARAGDEEACERLVRKYYPSIYQYCLLHIYDTYEAEDLTQEVFARAFASLDRYREYGKVKNYLYTIAGNVVKNYYKKKKDIPLEELPEVETENRVEMVGIRLDIEQEVRKLPEELREVAILSFFQELKQREIAELLQIKLEIQDWTGEGAFNQRIGGGRMKTYGQRIQEYRDFVQQTCIREEAESRAIKACQDILTEQACQMESKRTSYFEFLYEQSRFIKKKWWVLQAVALLYLWMWLNNNATDMKETMRLMGIFATMFVILIVPEVWKNRRNGAIEVEQASYYTLRQICAARVLLFAAVDFAIIMLFLAVTYQTTALTLNNLVVNFLLPVNVSCCICFRVLYSRWERSEYVAVLLCLLWVAVWTMLVANDAIYQRIASPVWNVMLVLTFAYVMYCVRRSLTFDEKMLEDYTNEIRI